MATTQQRTLLGYTLLATTPPKKAHSELQIDKTATALGGTLPDDKLYTFTQQAQPVAAAFSPEPPWTGVFSHILRFALHNHRSPVHKTLSWCSYSSSISRN